MARIFMDGFETGDSSFWNNYSNAGTVTATPPAGMSGSYMMVFSTYHGAYRLLSISKSEIYIAFKWYGTPQNITDPSSIFSFRDSAGTLIYSTRRNSLGFMEARLGSHSGALNATGTKILYPYITYLIEAYYKPLNSGGVFTTKIDGVQDINYSGDTTNGLEDIKSVSFGYDGVLEAASCKIDDIVIDDANWIGNTKLGIIVPDGTGTTNNWTASTGNAWDCLNEKPPSDTDYVYSNTTNQIATYAMTTIANMNTVKAVQLQGRAAYEGSPTPTKIQLGVRASGADYFATDISPGVGFAMNSKILELNPADSAAWEQADIDALEVGVKATA
jgi:hypothetical protein